MHTYVYIAVTVGDFFRHSFVIYSYCIAMSYVKQCLVALELVSLTPLTWPHSLLRVCIVATASSKSLTVPRCMVLDSILL